MANTFERLLSLQRVDTELRALKLELSALGGSAAEVKTEVGTKRSVTQAKRQEMADLERQRRDIEAKLADEEAKTKERRMRMQRIRNEKELGALKREIDLSRELSAQLEETLLKLLESGETKLGELKTLEGELAAAEARLLEREREHIERNLALAADLERLTAERTAVATEIDETVRSRYELLLERKGGLAVVEVRREGDCGGCRMRVPPQLITQIHRNSDVVFCPNCHRILCVQPPPPKQPAAS
ncbi:MAG: zinc ribbon domain-containing protein [Candidatus Binatia bacterium]